MDIRLIAYFLVAAALVFGGYRAGHAIASLDAAQERAARTDAALVRIETITKEVPKIVTKTVTKDREVIKEVERVVTVVEKSIHADCVLPDNFGVLLVAAANGIDPAGDAGRLAPFAGEYGCREVLKATLQDLQAGWRNTARLGGLQEAVRVILAANTKEAEAAR